MARFARGDQHVELVRDGRVILETTAFGTARRELHDERAALIAYYARLAELLDDRWTRTTPFDDDVLAEPTSPLVDAIDAGDAAARAVYTDWLLERGDPRGLLAALRMAESPDARAISSLERTRGLELFGAFAMLGHRWREQVAFGWRDGWIHELAFGRSASVPCERELMLHALHAPMARFARWLSLDAAYAQTLHDRVAPSPVLARIRGLRLQGHPLPVITALPNLEELELYDESAVSHPQLRRLRVVIASPLGVSLDGALPALERIELVSRSALGLWRTLMMYVPAQTVRTLAITTPALTEHHLTRIASLRAHVHVDITFET